MGTEDTMNNIPRDENFCTPQMAWELNNPYIMVRRCELQFIEHNLEHGNASRALEILRFMLERGKS